MNTIIVANNKSTVDGSFDKTVETVAGNLMADSSKDIQVTVHNKEEQRRVILYKLEQKVVMYEVPQRVVKSWV